MMIRLINTFKSLTTEMEELLRLKQAAKALGVNEQTLRNWDEAGKIHTVRTVGGRCRVPRSEVECLIGELERRKVKLYAHVSSFAQKDDLDRQVQQLKQFYPDAELFSDTRSDLKFDRKGFLTLLYAVQKRCVSKVVVVYGDRLARFGVDLIRRLFASCGTELEVLDSAELMTSGQELSRDFIAIIERSPRVSTACARTRRKHCSPGHGRCCRGHEDSFRI